jgi:hypothetical protein
MPHSPVHVPEVGEELAGSFEPRVIDCQSFDIGSQFWINLIQNGGFQKSGYRKLSADDARKDEHTCNELTRYRPRRARFARSVSSNLVHHCNGPTPQCYEDENWLEQVNSAIYEVCEVMHSSPGGMASSSASPARRIPIAGKPLYQRK